MEEQTQSTPPLEEAFHGQARLEGENELLRERINDLSFDFIALQKKYQMLFEENKLLAAKCHALDIKLQKQVLTTTVEPSTQLQEVVQHYEAKLDRLQKENTQLQLTVSDLKQNMEHKRHEHILQIDKLKVEKEKLQKLVDRHVLKL